ncbi:MAG: PsbP-related protein [Patescibacteria group bacterium]
MNPFEVFQKLIIGVFWIQLILFFVLAGLDILFFRFISKKKSFPRQGWREAILTATAIFIVVFFSNSNLKISIKSLTLSEPVRDVIFIVLIILIFLALKNIYQITNKETVKTLLWYTLYKIISFFAVSILVVVIAMGFLASYLQDNIKQSNNQKVIEENIKIDSDGDGLDDKSEKLYGTDLNNTDTDGDGYQDGAEINNGYNPLTPGNAKLKNEINTANWRTYINNKLGFGIQYPEDWIMQDNTEKEINSGIFFYPSDTIKQMEADKREVVNFDDFVKYTSISVIKYHRISGTLREEIDGFTKASPGYSIENITVNEFNGFKLSRQMPDNQEVAQINIFLETNNDTIAIEIHGSDVNKYLDTFNKFIPTLYLL